MGKESNPVCLVTGATGGIGKETARGLASSGATTIIVGRDPLRTRSAVEEMRSSTGNSLVDGIVADLSSQREIRALVAQVRSTYPRLHVLINNAGIFNYRRTLTVDGIESHWAVNHLAYFMIAESLADIMFASAPARIVNVSSASHYDSDIDFDDLGGERCYSGVRAYGQSKLANVLHAYDLARRLAGTGVTVNCLHPGVIGTAIGMNNGGIVGLAVRIRRLFLPSAVSEPKHRSILRPHRTSRTRADNTSRIVRRANRPRNPTIWHSNCAFAKLAKR